MEKPKRNMLRIITGPLKLITVEPYIFLSMFGLQIGIVSFQSLLMDRSCRNIHGYPDDICDDMDNHKDAQEKSIESGNNLYTALMLAASIPAALVAIFVGPWSDKYSRKWPMLIATCGSITEHLIIVFLTYNKDSSPLWFIAGSLLSGFSGGILVSISAASSYLSDVTDERSRPTRFAFLEFSGIFANVFGSLIGGQIFKAYGYLTVVSLSPCLHFCALLYAFFVLKDTKPPIPADKRCEMMKDFLTLDNIKQSYRTCTQKRPGNLRLQIWLLVLVDACFMFVFMGNVSIVFAFAKQMFKMDVTQFSNASTIFSVASAVVTVVMVPLLTKTWRLHESAVGLIGVLSLMSKLILLSVSYSEPTFYYAMLAGTLSNCISIAVQSRLSKLVAKEELGRVFSLRGIVYSFAPMPGTAIFLQVYNASLNFFPGLAYAGGCAFLLPSLFIFGWMIKLPTISVGDYAKEDADNTSVPLETASSNYNKLKEETF